MSRTPSSEVPLIAVGRYPRLSDAREYALALSARDVAYVIEREGDDWVLRVEERASEMAVEELAIFAAEEKTRRARVPRAEIPKLRTLPLFLMAWALGGMFFLQMMMGSGWTETGAASSERIFAHGEWWRLITALTLHADLSHVVANLATGLLFSASLIPFLGAGVTCLLLVLCGAIGNLINAWGYRTEAHVSIGASTAVFSALGILVGMELIVRWSRVESRNRWQLVVPLGAGLALLAFLGVGEQNTRVDFMAHWWGFCVGVGAGLIAALLRTRIPQWPHTQRVAAGGALLLIAGSWWLALQH